MPEREPKDVHTQPVARYASYLNPKHVGRIIGFLAVVGGAIGLLVWLGVLPTRLGGSAEDQSALRRQIEELEQKVDVLPEYLADLDETQKETLKAAYEEGRALQLEGYEAQDEEKHLEAIERFTRALPLAETDAQRASLHILRGNSFFSVSQFESAEEAYGNAIELAAKLLEPSDANGVTAVALGNLGLIYANRGDLARAEENQRQALAIERESGDRLGEAGSLGNLGNVYRMRGDLERAEDYYRQALAIDREIGDRLGEAHAINNLGLIYTDLDDLKLAEEHHQQALEIHREIDNRLGEGNALGNLGLVYDHRGELERAEEYHREALAIHREIGARLDEAIDLANLGLLAARRDAREEACQLLKEAVATFDKIEMGGPGPDTLRAKLEELGCG